jgi:osmotically-inducible protein OsmY
LPDNPAVTDPLIHRAVLERLDTLPVVTLQGVEIRIRQGIVDVDGYVMSQSEITRISRAIRGIDGVRAVRNTLRVPSSGSGIRSGMH